MTGLPAGENVSIRADDGEALLTYRSFASVVPLVAMVVAVVVVASGLAAVAFLFAEGRPIPALIALVLSAAFSVLIAMMVPPIHVTLHHANAPEVIIGQQSNVSFPIVTYVVTTADRKPLARLRRSVFSRLGRNHWTILDANLDHRTGDAYEESLSQAMLRKVAGKFSPRYQSNVVIRNRENESAWIIRRPNSAGESDLLEVTGDIDRRVAVALATLILGSEP